MKAITDNLGRQWELKINITNLQRVKEFTGVDLTKLVVMDSSGKIDSEKSTINTLAEDPVKLMMVIWTLCEKQASAKQIDAEAFFEGFAGDAIPAANYALLEEVADFFPSAQRQAFRKYIDLTRRCGDIIGKNYEKLLSDHRYEEFVEQQIQQIVDEQDRELEALLNSPTNSQEQ